jgi:protein-disulfide isomerase
MPNFKNVIQKTLPGIFVVAALNSHPAVAGTDPVVAIIGDEKITLSQVDKEGEDTVWGAQLTLYQERLKALQRLIHNKRLTLAANQLGMTADTLLQKVRDGFTLELSEDFMKVVYLGLTDEYLSEADPERLDEISTMMNNAKEALFQKKFETMLTKAHPVKILLQKPVQQIKRYDIEGDGLISLGPDNAAVTVHYFFDYSCNYCIEAEEGLKTALDHYGDQIRVLFRHGYEKVPEHERRADAAAVCAQSTGDFWGMHNALYELYQDGFEEESLIDAAKTTGQDIESWKTCYQTEFTRLKDYAYPTDFEKKYKIQGTPVYFVNGKRHVGMLDFAELKTIVDEELES